MSRFRVIAILITVLIIAVALVASGILPRLRERQTLRAQANTTAIPMVTVVHPKREAPAEEVVLPGNIQAFIDAPIYARTSGYLRRWYFDIGSRVKAGQLLAEIESPEVDQQLQQAREDLSTAEANLKLAEITAERYSALLKQDSIAKQDVDTAVQNAAARRSAVKSAQANVNRVQQMVAFEKIYAPFNGVITARNTDVGQLISSGSSSNANRELFHIAAINKLRVFVSVPQTYSHVTTPGLKADLTLPELPGQRFPGTLVRTSDAMDQNTRTLLVEVDVVNSTGLLFPGAYAQVHFKMKSQNSALIIPSASLIFRSEGLRVPVVTGNRANLIPVTLGRDFGSTVEVLSGLNEDTAVIADPPDSLVSGQEVRIRQKQVDPEGER
ncbi:MAG: efflux RND transporter periplasmic adaptor subunit [Acidobacteriaceae bacterium]|nr:efflux RND transporter periplasmic adaptor subunit [Acidobacteriaceae bacterium]